MAKVGGSDKGLFKCRYAKIEVEYTNLKTRFAFKVVLF
jgi:hypothetical protein